LACSVATAVLVPAEACAAKDKAARDKRDKRDKRDTRETQAREAYAAGGYQEALDIYTRLYAEKPQPVYLRNLGRCYQNLNDLERAIASFRAYLSKGQDIPADERSELEGYIKEMEGRKKRRAVAVQAARPVSAPLPARIPVPAAPPSIHETAVLVAQPRPAPTAVSEPSPFYEKAWFWGLVSGLVVAGTVGGLWAGGTFSSTSHNSCPGGFTCLQ
jgi:tetratricopeptide (TPR) repeat protein